MTNDKRQKEKDAAFSFLPFVVDGAGRLPAPLFVTP